MIKLIFGLTFVKIFLPDIPLAVGGATLAVSISEGAALLYVFTVYKLKNGKLPVVTERKTFFSDAKSIISFVIPITLVGVIIPLSHISDSFFIINILNTYTDKATALYGLLSGAASTVINLPVSLLFALAAVALPAVASAKSAEAATEEERRTLYFTLFASVFFAVVCFALAPFAVNILFGSLSDADKSTTVKLIKILSGNVVFLSVLQTVNSIHIARKNPYKPLVGLIIGVAVKTLLYPLLLNNPTLNIYGGAACFFACYFSACLVNLLLLIKIKVKDAVKKPYAGEFTN